MDRELSRKRGSGTTPMTSPSDVNRKTATADIATEYPMPEAEGLRAGHKAGVLSRGIGRSILAIFCLSPLLVTLYHIVVPYAPLKGEEGTWSSDVWQSDVPSGFRTKLRDGSLVLYASDGPTDPCGSPIGSTPGFADDPAAPLNGSIRGVKMLIWRDHGLLALSYDQYDPWAFFSRGSPPRRRVTVRYHQVTTQACAER